MGGKKKPVKMMANIEKQVTELLEHADAPSVDNMPESLIKLVDMTNIALGKEDELSEDGVELVVKVINLSFITGWAGGKAEIKKDVDGIEDMLGDLLKTVEQDSAVKNRKLTLKERLTGRIDRNVKAKSNSPSGNSKIHWKV